MTRRGRERPEEGELDLEISKVAPTRARRPCSLAAKWARGDP